MIGPQKDWKWTVAGVKYRYEVSTPLTWENRLRFTVDCIKYVIANAIHGDYVSVSVKGKWYKPRETRRFALDDDLPDEIKQDVINALDALQVPLWHESDQRKTERKNFFDKLKRNRKACL